MAKTKMLILPSGMLLVAVLSVVALKSTLVKADFSR